jgi:multimeric flavodoxin WrbA
LFSVIVHGDVEGTKAVRQSVSEWLKFMRLHPAGALAEVDRYIGYWKPYADNHLELDADLAMQGEVRNAAKTIVEAVLAKRSGTLIQPGQDLHEPRQK